MDLQAIAARRQQMIDISVPHIRCKTCAKVVGKDYDRFLQLTDPLGKNLSYEEAFNILGYKNECCRYFLANPIQLPDDPSQALAFDERLARMTLSEERARISTVPGPRVYNISRGGPAAGKSIVLQNLDIE